MVPYLGKVKAVLTFPAVDNTPQKIADRNEKRLFTCFSRESNGSIMPSIANSRSGIVNAPTWAVAWEFGSVLYGIDEIWVMYQPGDWDGFPHRIIVQEVFRLD